MKAERYTEGVRRQVKDGVSPLREAPSLSSRLETQLLHGEIFVVYDEAGGWAWGQVERDGYVGYLRADTLSEVVEAPTHRVCVLRTIVFPKPDIKSQPHRLLSLNAKLCVEEVEGRFARLGDGGYAIAGHLAPIDSQVADWVACAELFLRAPYLWGGKDSFGCDCSGLVQTSLETAGIWAPRDTDMQEAALGFPLPNKFDLSSLQRGDLVFWDGHVGIMFDATQLLHANAFHMMTAIEPLADAVTRIEQIEGPIRTIKRL